MTTPNEMPKRQPDKLREQILARLIEAKRQTWARKQFVRAEEGGEELVEEQVAHDALRWPLAQNVSENAVQQAARRWL